MLTIAEIQEAIHMIAPQYPIRKVQLFGSYAEGRADESSDIDVLVEFHNRPVTLLDFCGFQQELSELLKVEVDVLKAPLPKRKKEELMIDKVVHLYG